MNDSYGQIKQVFSKEDFKKPLRETILEFDILHILCGFPITKTILEFTINYHLVNILDPNLVYKLFSHIIRKEI